MIINFVFIGLIFQTEVEPEEKFFQVGLEKFCKQVGFSRLSDFQLLVTGSACMCTLCFTFNFSSSIDGVNVKLRKT